MDILLHRELDPAGDGALPSHAALGLSSLPSRALLLLHGVFPRGLLLSARRLFTTTGPLARGLIALIHI